MSVLRPLKVTKVHACDVTNSTVVGCRIEGIVALATPSSLHRYNPFNFAGDLEPGL